MMTKQYKIMSNLAFCLVIAIVVFAFAIPTANAYTQGSTSKNIKYQITSMEPPLLTTNRTGYSYEMTGTGYNAYFKSSSNTAGSIRFEKNGYYFIYDVSGGSMQWAVLPNQPNAKDTLGSGKPSNSQTTSISISGNVATYQGAFYNTTLTYTLTNDMLKENFILLGFSKAAMKNYTYLEYSGNIQFNASLKICTDAQCYVPSGTQDDFETNGKIYFKDSLNKTIFYLAEPTITDSSGNTIKGLYSVHGSNAQMNFWLRINKTFLENAIYPVKIDPTVVSSDASPDLKEISYTPVCVSDCHLPFAVTYSGTGEPLTLTLNPSTRTNINWTFFYKSIQDDIDVTDIKILNQVNTTKTIISSVYSNFTHSKNITDAVPFGCWNMTTTEYICSELNNTEQQISVMESYWQSIMTSNAIVTKDVPFYIDIIGKRKASLDSKAVDIVPSIFGFSLTELAWWNSSITNKMRFNVTNNAGSTLTDFNVIINQSSDLTTGFDTKSLISAGRMRGDCNDLWILNSTENGNLPFYIENNTCNTTKTIINFITNLSTGVNTFYVYYGSPTATNHENRQYVVSRNNATTWLDFSEGTGNTTYEPDGFTAYAGNFTLTNSTNGNTNIPTWNNTARGYGMGLEGFSDKALGQNQMMYGTQSTWIYSIELWTWNDQSDATVSDGPEMFSDQASKCHAFFKTGTGGTSYKWQWYSNTFGDWRTSQDVTIPLNTWTHFLIVKNDTNITFYVNGVSKNSTIYANADENNSAGCRQMTFGMFQNPTGRQWNGTVDNFRIYQNYVVSPSEAKAKYDGLTFQFYGQESTGLFVTMTNPINGTYYSTTNITFNYTATGSGVVDKCWYKLDLNANVSLPNCINGTLIATDGSHTLWIFANDTTGGIYNDSKMFFTDTIAPVVTITSPTNTSYSTTNITLTFTATDTNINTCTRELNGVNTTITNCQNQTFTANQGNNYVKVFANDSATNIGVSSRINFFVDSITPVVTITSPINTTYSTTNITLTFTATDTNAVTCTRELNGVNTSITGCQNQTFTAVQGSNNVKVYATDGLNIGAGYVNFFVDTIAPVVTITSPTNTTYATTNITLTFTATDSNINTCTRELNGANTTITNCQNQTFTASQGNNYVKVFANDTANNVGVSSKVNFFVDSIFPTITIQSPVNGTAYNYTPINLNFTASDVNIGTCTRELDGVNSTLTNCQNTTLNANNGSHLVKVFVNDTAGNTNVSVSNFTIDTHLPVVDITSPTDGGSYTTTNITLTYTASDPIGISGCKYSLNGAANITLPNCQNITFIAAQGTNTIFVFANDTANNFGYHSHTFYVDSIAPVVTIQSPSNATYTSNHTVFLNYTAVDVNIASCSYTLDGGGSVSLPSCQNTTISISLLGPHKINVTAADTFGNTNSTAVNFTIINNAPVVAIQIPVNGTYYGSLNFTLNYTVTDVDIDTCYWSLNNGANITLSGCSNTTFAVPSAGYYHIDLVVNDSWNNITLTTRYFTLFQGINLSALLPNGNAITTWNVTAINGTATITFSGLNNSALISWDQLPQGLVNFTATDNGLDSESWNGITISNATSTQQHNFTLYPITNVTLYYTNAGIYLSNWLFYSSPPYANTTVNGTTLQISNRVFPNGVISFYGSLSGYQPNFTAFTMVNSTGYNIQINTTKNRIIMYVVDEQQTGQKHGFNAQFITPSNITVLQVTGMRRGPSGQYSSDGCFDGDNMTGCNVDVSTLNSPNTTSRMFIFGQDYNNATYSVSMVIDASAGAGSCQDGTIIVFANGGQVFTATHHLDYTSTPNVQVFTHNFTVQNTNGNYTRAINFTVRIDGSRCGPTYGAIYLSEFNMISNSANYLYVDDNTIEFPLDVYQNFTSVNVFYRGEETYETNYTQTRMLVATLSQYSNYNLVGYLLRDTLGIMQNFIVVNANNIPLPNALITISRWFTSSVSTPITQCFSNIAGACNLWVQPSTPTYSMLTQLTGYVTNYTSSILFTGVPNPAYIYMQTGQSVNFTSVFNNLQTSLTPTATYFNNAINTTCQVFSGDGNINFINMTAYRILNSTIMSIYNSTYVGSQPSGASITLGLNANGRFDVQCVYQWVSNATGQTKTYQNTAFISYWIYSDALNDIANQQGSSFGGIAGIILAIGIILLIAGPIAYYSPPYGFAVGVFLLLLFAWLGMVPWYVGGLAILTGISMLILRMGL